MTENYTTHDFSFSSDVPDKVVESVVGDLKRIDSRYAAHKINNRYYVGVDVGGVDVGADLPMDEVVPFEPVHEDILYWEAAMDPDYMSDLTAKNNQYVFYNDSYYKNVQIMRDWVNKNHPLTKIRGCSLVGVVVLMLSAVVSRTDEVISNPESFWKYISSRTDEITAYYEEVNAKLKKKSYVRNILDKVANRIGPELEEIMGVEKTVWDV